MKLVRAAKVTSKFGITRTHAEGGRFTGVVQQEALIGVNKALLPANVNGVNVVRVTFAPNARTHWHKHPAGQVLHVLSGKGRIQEGQEKNGELIEILPGDTVYTAPNVWHWHGAAPDSFMVHIAINLVPEDIDDDANHRENWGEAVSEDAYNGKLTSSPTE